MKKIISNSKIVFMTLSLFFLMGSISMAQDKKDKEIIEDSKEAKVDFIEGDPEMAKLFSSSYGYSIFPNVGKGGIGIGGAAGNGTAYERGKLVGMTKLSQVSIGFQFGGQEYREVLFFETKQAMDRFKQNKTEFSAQVSAVAVKSGVSANAKYVDGVIVFTMQKGGLMYEASVGGQKFKFKELE